MSNSYITLAAALFKGVDNKPQTLLPLQLNATSVFC